MLNNYPIKQTNQHKPLEFEYKEYIDTSIDWFDGNASDEAEFEVESQMSNSLFDMRREFKRNVKKLRNLYPRKAPKVSAYKFDNTKSASVPLSKIRFAKGRA